MTESSNKTIYNCIRKQKCKQVLMWKGKKKDNFICSGIGENPTKYKDDVIWLCLHGCFRKTHLEMTPEEAAFIASSLNASLGDKLPSIQKEI